MTDRDEAVRARLVSHSSSPGFDEGSSIAGFQHRLGPYQLADEPQTHDVTVRFHAIHNPKVPTCSATVVVS